MQRLFATVILILIPYTVAQSQTPTAREIAKSVFPSIVMLVKTTPKGKPVSLGSGFFIGEDLIVTNNHVVSGGNIFAKIIGQEKTYKVARVIASDKTRDLAVLRVSDIKAPPLTLGDSSQVAVGDEIYAVGNPEGFEGTFSQGIVSGIRQLGRKRYFQITAPISHGSSGGAILNKFGEVIGVTVAFMKEGQNLNFAIPASDVVALLEKIWLKYR